MESVGARGAIGGVLAPDTEQGMEAEHGRAWRQSRAGHGGRARQGMEAEHGRAQG